MSYSLGIDLGTTFVTAAIATESAVEAFTLGKNSVAIPAVVHLCSDGTLISGTAEGEPGKNGPDRNAREVMSRLGDPAPVLLDGEPHEIIDLVGILLRDVAHTVTKTHGKPPEHVVLTYPASWGPFRRALLDKAARQAGLHKPTIVTEPEAAAAHHFTDQPWNDGETVAVYDLGGHTFNATVLRKQAGKVEILGTPERVENIGGNGFDDAIAARVDHHIGGVLGRLDKHRSQTRVTLKAVRQACIRAKETLSTSDAADFPVYLPSQRCDVHLTRSELEDLARESIASTVAALSRTLQAAEITPADLSAVLLVGGSSAMPLVARMVAEELERPIIVDAHPQHVIALGAARLAAQAAHHDKSDIAGTLQGGRHYRKPHHQGQPDGTGSTAPAATPAPAMAAVRAAPSEPGVTTAASKPAVQSVIPAVQGHTVTIPAQRTSPPAWPATPSHNGGSHTATVPPAESPPPSPPPPPPATPSPDARRSKPVVKRRSASALTDRVRQPQVLVGSGAAIVLTGLVVVTIFNGGKEASTPSALTHPAKPEPSAAAIAGPAVPAPGALGPAAAIPTVDSTIRIGDTPSFAAVAPDGARAYIANSNAQNITVLNTANNEVISTIPIATGPPQFLSFAPDGRTLYITISDVARAIHDDGTAHVQSAIHAIAVLDVASNTVTATIPQSGTPLRPAVSPDGRRLFVANHDIPSVSVIDTTTNTVIGQITVAPNPHGVTFSPDGSRAYTANHESDLVSVIDTSTLNVLRTIPVGSSPHSIAVNPRRPIVANVNYDARSVSEIDTSTGKIVATIPVGQNPQDIAWAPDGRFAYVVNVSSNTVSVIDATTNKVTATIPTGDGPTSIAVAPDGRQAYVSNLDGGSVTVLKLPR